MHNMDLYNSFDAKTLQKPRCRRKKRYFRYTIEHLSKAFHGFAAKNAKIFHLNESFSQNIFLRYTTRNSFVEF